jgi:hypothetical protein
MLNRIGIPLLMALCFAALAQHTAFAQHPAPSPYQGQEAREIKALSPEDVRALATGEGMGLAKPAELNGYPGPAHVLQLADALGLSPTQRASVQAIQDRMKQSAVTTGLRIVALEQELDRAFAERAIDPASLQHKVESIAQLQGELRAIHLRAHLETLPVLSQHQAHQYQVLRGYNGTPGGAPAHGHPRGAESRH